MKIRMPYIGICDVSKMIDIDQFLSLFNQRPEIRHRLMIGAMMSYKTLHALPSRWTNVFPPLEDLPTIFSCSFWRALNTLHYADYAGTSNFVDFIEGLSKCGQHVHGIQFDMTWPDPDDLYGLAAAYPELSIVLQVGPKAFEEVGNDPQKLVERLQPYEHRIDWVLLDKSAGTGTILEPDVLSPYIEAIKKRDDLHMDVAVAGGLGPDSVDVVKPLIRRFGRDLSIDAQARLHEDCDPKKPFSVDRAIAYLERALDLFT